MILSSEPSVLWERNGANHSQLNRSQTTDCFWEDLQREVGFYWTLLHAQNRAQLEFGGKGGKRHSKMQKLEQTSSLSGAAILWLLHLWLLKGFYLQTKCCSFQLAPTFSMLFFSSLSTLTMGLTGHRHLPKFRVMDSQLHQVSTVHSCCYPPL